MNRPAGVPLSPERWRAVLAAADQALDLTPTERAAFLARCSADDPALGAELEALLAGGEADSALDRSAAAFVEPLLADLPQDPGEGAARIGPYRIIGAIGRGGMGAVYLAERADDQYRKQVALKLPPSWNAGDEHRVRRFVEERQILAALEHPDIARLLDGGVTPDGLPWFAMEYVEGLPIDRYCEEQSLPVERRLALFTRVCAAVQYAHRSLVVHRDLKPANILVTADGTVKLLDFGIAKLLGGDPAAAPPELTHDGERVLTPLYASPEQVRGQPVSTASDVYALGVLLYLLLTGRHPYRLSSYQPHEVARAILEQEPERPSVADARLGRRLRGDLDAIVLKAMEKDSRLRYGSAEQLGADVDRHLTGLPVTARPANRRYLARKFLRRHRLGVAVAAGVALLVLGFTGVTTLQSLRIRAQAARITAERDRAEAVVTHLSNVFRTSVPSPREGRGVTSAEVLDSSAALVERDLSGHPGTRARLLLAMGQAYHARGSPDRARDLLESSLALQRSDGDDPRGLAATLAALGELRAEAGDLEGADRAYQEALVLRREHLGPRHVEVARTLNGLAAVRLAQQRLEVAESLSRRALAVDLALPGDQAVDVARSLRGVAHARLARGDYAEAARLYAEALGLLRRRLPDEDPDVAGTILDLSAARHGLGDKRSADSLLRRGLGLRRRLAATAVMAGADSSWLRLIEPQSPTPAPRVAPVRAAFTSQIAFTTDRDGPDPVGHLGRTEIYVMNPDGTGQRRLTYSEGQVGYPVVSPDGRLIAFLGEGREIFLVEAGGGEPRRLTRMGPNLAGSPATWSPDGKRLAFSRQRDLYVINVDGSGLTRLTSDQAGYGAPAWSPRGGKIAFARKGDGGADLYLVNEDGTAPALLAANVASGGPLPGQGLRPAWSPDGRRIAFTSNRDGNLEIYAIDADGGALTRLTNNPTEDANPSWSPDGRKIAFHRRVLGHGQVFVMNADGSAPVPLTDPSPRAFSGFPNWGPAPPAGTERPRSPAPTPASPDAVRPAMPRPSDERSGGSTAFASQIAFVSDRHGPDPVGHLGHSEIYVMNSDGTEQRRITHNSGAVAGPAISPDGSRIAFHTTGAAQDIFVIRAGGGEPVRVTNLSAAGLGARSPTWSPDGKRLAFSSTWRRPDIHIINLDGTGLRNLTNHAASDKAAAWSPKGDKIAFESDRAGSHELYVMDDDGSDPVRLTVNAAVKPDPLWSLRPDWSPDGRQIAFTSDRDGNQEIYVINADGTGLKRLTNDPAEDGKPSWSPDGRQIAFYRRVLGHGQIFVMNADGSSPRRVTALSTVFFNAFPDWGPAPPEAPRAPRP